jgi:hypothetical protein
MDESSKQAFLNNINEVVEWLYAAGETASL